ncbi:MAG: DNA-binding response regulator [Chloroflexi bacterium HGW-Chloroflexi-3]|nr:MAG: DNA-binding response regulator [Chloroflexi bacterium HGW-Chloroflexi-3]
MAKQILLIDDDALLRRSLAFNLQQAGYETRTAANAEDGLASADQQKPDLILLDINLPGMDGLDALKKLRNQMHIPVIMLTARRRELDEVLGLELGADDYVTKPFDFSVLLAHVKAVLRRSQFRENSSDLSTDIVEIGNLRIDSAAHTAIFKGRELDLSPREFELLFTLARSTPQVLSTDEILTRVWGAEFIGQPQVVYVHIRWLREKLEDVPNRPKRILTVRGVGYKYQPEKLSI